jgi:hypothetical protein
MTRYSVLLAASTLIACVTNSSVFPTNDPVDPALPVSAEYVREICRSRREERQLSALEDALASCAPSTCREVRSRIEQMGVISRPIEYTASVLDQKTGEQSCPVGWTAWLADGGLPYGTCVRDDSLIACE